MTLCKVVLVYILALSVSATTGQKCNGGGECIILNDCTGLYNQLQRGATPRLTQLLRGLHCGFQGEQPMKSAQRTQKPKSVKAKKLKPIATAPELNFFDLLWGAPTMRPSTRPTSRPLKKKPAPKPMAKPAVRPPQKLPVKLSHKPAGKPAQRPLVRPAIKPIFKPTVHTPVNPLKPGSRKICCPPQFQGPLEYGSSSTAANMNENSNGSGGGGGWNRGGGPSTNSNRPNNWSGGSSSNSNSNANGWNNGGNSNSNGNGWSDGANGNTNPNNWNGDSGNSGGHNGGEVYSGNPISLLPTRRECGIQNNDRIVGGTRADLDEHPWMTLIRYDKPVGWGFYCGGVLISSKYVLTAAHCVKGQDLPTNWRLSKVRLGEWNTSSVNDCVMDDCTTAVQDIPVEDRIAHEGYDPQDSNQHNDIALLRLAQPVQFNDFVKPICLPLSKDMKNNGFDGYTMEVAGWGKTESHSESEVKLKVEVPVVSRSECATVFNRVNREIINKQLCAGGTAGKDSCRGDSGGALMGRVPTAENWFALGVVSYGPSPCGTPGWPGVYTRVGAYVDWILSKIKP